MEFFFLFLLKTEKEGVVKHFSVSVDKAGERSAQDPNSQRCGNILSTRFVSEGVSPPALCCHSSMQKP